MKAFASNQHKEEALELVVGNPLSRWNAPFCCVQIRKYEISIHLSIYPSCVWLLERNKKREIRGKRKENQHNKFSSLTLTLSPLQLLLLQLLPGNVLSL
jgi:hypothetical protein